MVGSGPCVDNASLILLCFILLTWTGNAFLASNHAARVSGHQNAAKAGLGVFGDATRPRWSALKAKSEIGPSGLTEMESLWETLTAREGVESRCRLVESTVGDRTVAATAAALPGEMLLSIPGRLCIWANRDGTIDRGLDGQSDMTWAVAGDLRADYPDLLRAQGLTWDLRLAVALLEAASEQRCAGGFWDVYGFMLPAPHTVTMPLCFPQELTAEVQNPFMMKAAGQQQVRLESHYPTLVKPNYHPKLKIYQDLGMTSSVPNALMWCFALVRSRCFSASPERFAFVPFLDMCNHWVEPNADYSYNEAADSFDLVALKPIRSGDEILISYGQGLSNDDLMVRYGFVVEGNPHASALMNYKKLVADDPGVKLSDTEVKKLENMQQTLYSLSTLSIETDQDRTEVTRLKGVLEVLNVLLTRHESGDLRRAAEAVLAALTAVAKAEFATRLEDDRRALQEARQNPGTDARLLAALEYRCDRKQQFRIARNALTTFIEILDSQDQEENSQQ